MFGKLLKNDFTHYFKLWLVGAVTALALSFVGGVCLRNRNMLYGIDGPIGVIIAMMATMVMIVSVLSIFAFTVLSTVLICMRYAKNCYSDEGYLTFTLPAKRSTIFNAKFVTGFLYNLMAVMVAAICFLIFLGIGIPEAVSDMFYALDMFMRAGVSELGMYFWIYAAVIAVWVIIGMLLGLNILFFSITFAGTKVRKNKVIAGIGVYYLASIILGTVSQLAVFFFASAIDVRAHNMSNAALLVLMLIGVIWTFGGVAALYYSQLHMLDKKLNLA